MVIVFQVGSQSNIVRYLTPIIRLDGCNEKASRSVSRKHSCKIMVSLLYLYILFHSPRRWGLKVELLGALPTQSLFHSPRRWGLKDCRLSLQAGNDIVSLPT